MRFLRCRARPRRSDPVEPRGRELLLLEIELAQHPPHDDLVDPTGVALAHERDALGGDGVTAELLQTSAVLERGFIRLEQQGRIVSHAADLQPGPARLCFADGSVDILIQLENPA